MRLDRPMKKSIFEFIQLTHFRFLPLNNREPTYDGRMDGPIAVRT